MAELLVSAPAKINLHLEVLGLRPDGFHELAMVMQMLDLADQLRLRPTADGQISLTCNRADLPTDGSNLIVKAAELLKARVGLPELGASIELEKRIPIGAGLAGGSSNGAAALVGLNALWGCGFSRQQLLEMAAQLGSDMPFCIDGGTQLCFGRGEVLEPAALAGAPRRVCRPPGPMGAAASSAGIFTSAVRRNSSSGARPCEGGRCWPPWRVSGRCRPCAMTCRAWWSPKSPACARA